MYISKMPCIHIEREKRDRTRERERTHTERAKERPRQTEADRAWVCLSAKCECLMLELFRRRRVDDVCPAVSSGFQSDSRLSSTGNCVYVNGNGPLYGTRFCEILHRSSVELPSRENMRIHIDRGRKKTSMFFHLYMN